MQLSKKNWKVFSLFFIVLSGLNVHAFCQYLASLKTTLENRWPIEYNSFYYLVEFRDYAATGSGYYSSLLPFFLFFSKIQKIFGMNEVQIYNAVVVGTFLFFALALAAIAFDKKRPLVSLAILYTVLSSRMTFFADYTFLKQAAGMGAFAGFLAFVHLNRLTEKRNWKAAFLLLSVIFLIFAAAFHKFSGCLGILFLLLAYKEKISKKMKWGLFGTVSLLFLFLLIQKHPDGSDIFQKQWPPLMYSYVINQQISPYEAAEFISYLFFGFLLAGFFLWKKIQAPSIVLLLSLFFLLNALFATPGAWRFTLSAGWLLLIALALFQSSEAPISLKKTMIVLSTLVIFLNGIVFSKLPRAIGPGMEVSSIEARVSTLDKWLPKDAIIIAPHGIQFRVKYFLNRESTRLASTGIPENRLFTISSFFQNMDCADINNFSGDFNQVNCFFLDSFWKIYKGR